MAIITSGLYKVTFKQLYISQRIINTFWYESTLGLDDLQDVCSTAFDTDILPAMKLVQSSSLAYSEIIVDNVTGDLAPVSLTPTTSAGTTLGTPQQSYVAAGFKRVRTTKDTRNGSMRIAGLTEDDTTGNGFEAAYKALLETFADVLEAQISDVGGIFDPVIVKSRPLGTEPWVTNAISSVAVKGQPTSQVSRKAGVGV